jgi:hypothetical protein
MHYLRVVLYSISLYNLQHFDVDPALVIPFSLTLTLLPMSKKKNSLLFVIAVMDLAPRYKSFQIRLRYRIQCKLSKFLL